MSDAHFRAITNTIARRPRHAIALAAACTLVLVGAIQVASHGARVAVAQGAGEATRTLSPGDLERLGTIGGQRKTGTAPLSLAKTERFLAGLAAMREGRHANAVAFLRPLVDKHERDDEWVLNAYGAALLESGEPAAAQRVLGRALNLYPGNGYLHLNLAWAFLDTGQDIQAVPHLSSYLSSEIAQQDPRLRRRAHIELSEAHLRTGRIRDREVGLEVAFKDFANDPWFAELLAETKYVQGEDAEFRRLADLAVRTYDAAQSDGPEPEAHGRYRVPLAGPALVRGGFNSDPGHHGLRMRYAVALWPVDEQLHSRPEGVPLYNSPVDQWVGFGAPVLAAREGTVIIADDAHPDQPRTGNPRGLPFVRANMVALRHDDGEVSIYRHLKQHSVRAAGVAVGDRVRVGQPIGAVGSSGTRVTFPHLGFRVARDSEDGLRLGLRFRFDNIERYEAYSWNAAGEHEPRSDDYLRHAGE